MMLLDSVKRLEVSPKVDQNDIGNMSDVQSLMYKVKTQYVQVSNIIDTSIKHAISRQSI